MNDLFAAQHPDEIEHNGITYVRKDLANAKTSNANGVSGEFDEFMAQYKLAVGRKIGTGPAEKAWKKLKAQERKVAVARVCGYMKQFRKLYPTASPMLPASYLNGNNWKDEAEESPSTAKVQGDEMQAAANAILSGKYFLCTQITAATARTLIERKMVTLEQCREVRINI